jgi:hypothetical protein
LLNPFFEKRIHLFAQTDDVYPAVKPTFHVQFKMNEQKRIGRPRGYANIDITVIVYFAAGDGAEDAKRKDPVFLGILQLEVTQGGYDFVSVHRRSLCYVTIIKIDIPSRVEKELYPHIFQIDRPQEVLMWRLSVPLVGANLSGIH